MNDPPYVSNLQIMEKGTHLWGWDLWHLSPNEKGNLVIEKDIADKTDLAEVGGHAEHLELDSAFGADSYGWEARINGLREAVRQRLTDADKRVERMSDEVLRRGKAAIATIDHWTQHALCVNEGEVGVRPNSPQAARWCAMGATYKGAGLLGAKDPADTIAALILAQHRLHEQARKVYGYGTSVVDVNDKHGHERAFKEIHKLFDGALKETTDEASA